jgi:predicted nucleic acid-binding protein
MGARASAFLDTSVLFAAVLSESGGARVVLNLGEVGAVRLRVGPQVLREAEAVQQRKAPASKPRFALLLDRSRIEVSPEPEPAVLQQASALLAYAPDARVLAEAMKAGVDYLVTLDRKHLAGNPAVSGLPFLVGTPGEFLAWLRGRLLAGA